MGLGGLGGGGKSGLGGGGLGGEAGGRTTTVSSLQMAGEFKSAHGKLLMIDHVVRNSVDCPLLPPIHAGWFAAMSM